MRTLIVILLFFPFVVLSQSVHIDGPTGQISDLATVTMPAGTDILVLERNDSSKNITFDKFTDLPHGAFAFHDSAVTLTMSTGVWSLMSNPTNNLFTAEDTDDLVFAGDSVTLTYGGDYMSIASISFGGTAGDSYEFAVFKNGAIVAYSTIERTTSQTDVGNVSLLVYLFSMSDGDDLTLKIRNTASNDDATLVSISWIIWRLHI